MLDLLTTNPLLFLVYVLSLVVAVTIHEFCHAKVADHLGDPTPQVQGRVSLNPLRHLDPFGTLFLFLFGFGWGKPVQFDPFNLKDPRRDAALISIAGPGSNFAIALILSLLLRLFIYLNQPILISLGVFLFVPMITLNTILGLFNFIPIAPLDGFKIVGGLLPREKAHEWYSLERYGLLFLLLLIIPIGGSNMLGFVLTPTLRFILGLLIPPQLLGLGII